MTRKRAEGSRPDIVGPHQPHPVDPLDLGQLDGHDAGLFRGASMAQPEGVGKGVPIPLASGRRPERLA
jgi:hypothetical protein